MIHRPHFRQLQARCVNQRGRLCGLSVGIRWNRTGKLSGHALRTQAAKLRQGLHACLKFFVGAEFRRVLFHIRRYQFGHFRNQPGGVRSFQKFREILMVQLRIRRTAGYPIEHRTVPAAGYGQRRVYGVVYHRRRVLSLERPESQIIVPGNHGQTAFFLIKIVVVDHTAGVAVAVADVIMHHKVTQNLLYIQRRRVPFPQFFQRLYQPFLVRVRYRSLSALKNIGIALRVVVRVLQLYVRRSHTASGKIRRFGHSSRGRKASFVSRALFRYGGLIGGIHPSVRSLSRLEVPKCRGAFFIPIQAVHVEAPAIASAAAHTETVGLIQIPAGLSGTLHIALFYALCRQIQPPILAVDGDVNVTAQRRVNSEICHQPVSQAVLHIGIVLNDVVQTELVKAVIRASRLVMVELQLETVPVAVHGGNHAERSIALCPDADILIGFPVDYHGAGGIFLIFTGLQKPVPVVHHNFNGMDPAGIEQPRLVSQRRALGLHPPAAQHQRRQQRNQHRRQTDSVYMLMGRHERLLPYPI